MVQQIREELKNLAEEDYKQFNERLLPGVKNVIGVRLPALRKIAKKWQEIMVYNIWMRHMLFLEKTLIMKNFLFGGLLLPI